MTRDLRGSFVDADASGYFRRLFYYGAESQVQPLSRRRVKPRNDYEGLMNVLNSIEHSSDVIANQH